MTEALRDAAEFGNENPFQAKRAAMGLTHLWYQCCASPPDDDGNPVDPDWDIAAVPSYNGTTTANFNADTFRIWGETEHPQEAFEVLTYLLGEASADLLGIYGGMPARIADQDAFFAGLDEKWTQGVDWQVAIDGVEFADNPNFEAWMPNYQESFAAIVSFSSVLRTEPDLDVEAEIADFMDGAPSASSTEPRSDTIGPVRRPRRAGPTLDGGLDGDRRARVAEGAGGVQAAALQPGDARGAVGLRLHLAVDRRLPAVHPDPDDRHLRLHLHQHQPDPGRADPVRGSRRTTSTSFNDPRTWDALGVTFRFAAIALPIGLLLPFALALLLNSKSLRGSRYFQALFFMPFVIPFVAALFAWSGMLNPEAGLDQRRALAIGIDGPGLDQRPGLDLSVARAHRAVGDRQRHHHQHRGPAERPDRAV